MADVPETRYAKMADGPHIAYQIAGDGPADLMFMHSLGSHIEAAWDVPAFARGFLRLASFSRLIRFDIRGSGLSDPLSLSEQPTLEERAKEMLAVLDAAGSERAALVANNLGGLLAIFFAATHPKRTSSLVLDGCYARLARAPDYPWGVPSEILDRAVARAKGGAGPAEADPVMYLAPNAYQDSEFATHFRRYYRSVSGPAAAGAMAEMAVFADVRPVLGAIQAPALVMYRSGDRFAGRPHAEYLAQHISDAKLVQLPGEDNLIFVGDSGAAVAEIEAFLTGARHAADTDRVLATVLFTDIVGSTEHAAELGDRRWRDLLDSHDQVVRRQLERFGGREVNTAGDGFLATFDGPGHAIQCACAIRDAVRSLGVAVRVGLHTGEIEVRGTDVAGMAVHIGARVSALAGPGEVLVSSTVKDLVVGSNVEFTERGERELKGVPGTWHLFAVHG